MTEQQQPKPKPWYSREIEVPLIVVVFLLCTWLSSTLGIFGFGVFAFIVTVAKWLIALVAAVQWWRERSAS